MASEQRNPYRLAAEAAVRRLSAEGDAVMVPRPEWWQDGHGDWPAEGIRVETETVREIAAALISPGMDALLPRASVFSTRRLAGIAQWIVSTGMEGLS